MAVRLRRRYQPLAVRIVLGLCEVVASLRLAVVLIAVTATVLAWATCVESRYGDEAARFGIYGAWWFTGLTILLTVNVLAAALVRFPWKRHQTGFVVVHSGIVVLLIGCLLSRWYAVDARLPIFEGRCNGRAIGSAQHFRMAIRATADSTASRFSDPRTTSPVELVDIPFEAGPFNWGDYRELPWFPWSLVRPSPGVVYDADGIRLEALDYCSDCVQEPIPQITLRIEPASQERLLSEEQGRTVRLGVRQLDGAHVQDQDVDLRSRQQLPHGQWIVFWMTSSHAQTEAFRNSGPRGPTRPLGTLVLNVAGGNVELDVEELQKESRARLGDSGLEAELVRFDRDLLAVELLIHGKTGKPDRVLLFADFPEFNQQDHRHRVFGTYWLDAAKAEGRFGPEALARAAQPRLDIVQDSRSKLHYRTWISGRVEDVGLLSTDGQPLTVFENSKNPLSVRVEDFVPCDVPSTRVVPLPFNPRKNAAIKNRQVRLRLRVDGNTQDFWLPGISPDPFQEEPRAEEQRTVQGRDHRVTMTMPRDEVHLGFQVCLRKFQRKLDPGSSQPSHYSSLVDFRRQPRDEHGQSDRCKGAQTLRENVLITLNAPVDFADPRTGRSYRLFQESFSGPWRPGSPVFDEVVRPADARSRLFLSWLAVNYDPGRGLKYAGCLLISIGVGITFYMRTYFFRRPLRNMAPLAALMFALVGAPGVHASEELDWRAWQAMPVFEGGRLKPLDSFARAAVEEICGAVRPRLEPEGALPGQRTDALQSSAACPWFPDGRPRRFTSSELLFSWLAEPDKWDRVPFLVAEHEQLRTKLLGLPVAGSDGHRLKYASPWQVENAPAFRERIAKLRREQAKAEQQGKPFVLSGVDRKVKNLYDAYRLFRLLTFTPSAADAPRDRFDQRLASVAHEWSRAAGDLRRLEALDQEKGSGALVRQADEALLKLIAVSRKGPFALEEVESSVVSLEEAAAGLARQFAQHHARFEEDPPDWDRAQLDRVRAKMKLLAVETALVARQVDQLHRTLYDSGYALRLVPALDPAALEEDRDPSDDIQPWLSFPALMVGSEALLRGYPEGELADVREAFRRMTSVYVDRTSPDRPRRFQEAASCFAAAVRRLGQRIEPERQKLPIRHRDKALLQATAYPPVGYTRAELLYNEFNPFFWSWVVSLIAVIGFALGFGVLRKPMLVFGIVVLLVAQGCIVYGFAIRSYITGWAPVTNMFETVVFAVLTVALLGVWFTLLPLLWPGLSSGWRMTAIPLTPEAAPLTKSQLRLARQGTWMAAQGILLPVRLLLAAGVFCLLTSFRCGTEPSSAVISLLPQPDLGAVAPTWNAVLSWAVGMGLLVFSMWLLPRVMMSIPLAVFLVPYSLARLGLAGPLAQVRKRQVLVVVGAVLALLGSLLAYYAPSSVFNREINPLMPVLRDNFWLLLHVLTITASYGAGALAWGLSNIAMAYYLFGRYRAPVRPSVAAVAEGHIALRTYKAPPKRFPHHPPEACAALGTYAYKAIQVAVLLLAVGTILGALWADVAWGRFWGWDPKEVWALVSLLVYLAILHGRYAGWFGNFGLHVGAVLGATAILWAWYGVNFFLGTGLHTYGEGAGGAREVALLLACNWLYVLAASIRYLKETRIPVEPTTRDEEWGSAK